MQRLRILGIRFALCTMVCVSVNEELLQLLVHLSSQHIQGRIEHEPAFSVCRILDKRTKRHKDPCVSEKKLTDLNTLEPERHELTS
jgi:hypothetical protein